MRRAGWIIFLAAVLPLRAADPAAETWKGEGHSRFSDERVEWVFELVAKGGAIEGTVTEGAKSLPVTGSREGVWMELTWKDTGGKVTQARGVVAEGEWRGLVISGGGGALIEYGRVRAAKEGR